MGITRDDINLDNYLEKVAPESFPDPPKLTLPDADFILIAAVLKGVEELNKLTKK